MTKTVIVIINELSPKPPKSLNLFHVLFYTPKIKHCVKFCGKGLSISMKREDLCNDI